MRSCLRWKSPVCRCQGLARRSASSLSPQNRADDDLLRQIFDAPTTTWRKSLKLPFSLQTGLFGNVYLTSPDGFPRFATDSLRKAELLAHYVSENHASMPSRLVVKAFDRLSDTLCSVLDLAEFVRNAHPDTRYIKAAEQAYGILHEFMNTLNTHTGLFAALSHISDTRERLKELTDQEAAVLEILLADFHRSGVHLDGPSRAKFVHLSTQIAQAERKAFTDHDPQAKDILLPVAKAAGLWPNPNHGMMTADGHSIKIPTTGWEADSAMQRLDNSSSRKDLLAAIQKPRDDQLANLDFLFKARGELAHVVGQESYGASILRRQMAKSPEQVEAFLLNLAQKIRPQAQTEWKMLTELKRKHKQLESDPVLHRWDEDYYSAMHMRRHSQRPSADLSPYLSVGTVIQGLSRLFEQLYGIRFVAAELQAGEGWHPDVRRLDVMCEQQGRIGSLYCDLFSRSGKSPGLAAHFTVRCGRLLETDSLLPDEETIATGMLQGQINGKNYQLPVIALQCDFAPAMGNTFASLSFHEVSTLFHEMGHAIHCRSPLFCPCIRADDLAMLGITDYQTVSGTRVVADFVELPSQIMESFAASPSVWPLFARHYRDDTPAPVELLNQTINNSSHLQGLSKYRQFMRSLLDQHYHSSRATLPGFDSTLTLASLERDFGLSPVDDPVNPWQVQFTHLAGYGGTYYSYIFDKAMADKIYNKIFSQDPLSRRSGENFKNNLLRHGGSRDAWQCLADVLDEPGLASGDKEAMRRVGQWALASKS